MKDEKTGHIPVSETFEKNGKVWELSPMNLGDFRAVELHIKEGLNKEEAAFGLFSKEWMTRLLTIENLSFAFWRSLRKKHPEVTREQADELVDTANVGDVMQKLLRVCGIELNLEDVKKNLLTESTEQKG